VGSPRRHSVPSQDGEGLGPAFAAVIKDLKSRGLFKDTLVVCGSEFGRTPVVEIGQRRRAARPGAIHNPFGFSMWLAGGGIKGGMTYGATMTLASRPSKTRARA
jgi:uncharacterized protein (DUF1501 family)